MASSREEGEEEGEEDFRKSSGHGRHQHFLPSSVTELNPTFALREVAFEFLQPHFIYVEEN